MIRPHLKPVVIGLLFLAGVRIAPAQDNYEIQVYPSSTVAEGATMVELHSNYTVRGSGDDPAGLVPSESAFHETLELTHGMTSWLEVGWYIFTNARRGSGWQWAGDHLRPRIRAPAEWNWPVGVSISTEFGYARPEYASDPWSLEIRPIIDKQIGDLYLSFNPAADLAFTGADAGKGLDFSPAGKISLTITPLIAVGFEYYGALRENQQQIVPAVDLDIAPGWEFNAGYCIGVTRGTDRTIAKVILGRQIGP